MNCQFHKDEQGFTLVEMIIAFGILGIVSLMIVGFIMTGTRSYTKQSSDVNVQTEAQLTLNQLSDRIIDTSRAISYKESPGESLLTIFNDDEIYLVRWSEADERLYAAGITGDFSGIEDANDLDLTGVTWSVMADYMTGFNVNVDEIAEKGQVYITLEFNDSGSTYKTSGHVTLRNNLLVNEGDIGVIYPEGPTDVPSTITGVTIDIGSKTLNAGGTTPVSARVSGTGYPDQDVSWSISGATSASTGVSGGMLIVGADENAESFVITARSTVDQSKYASVTVVIKGIRSVSISPKTETLKPGMQRQFTATVQGLNLDNNPSSGDQAVIWTMSLSEGSDIQASLSSTGLLTIDEASGVNGTIYVTATSYMNRLLSDTASVTLEANEPERKDLTIQSSGNIINRGGSLDFTATVAGSDGSETYTWSAEAKRSDGTVTQEGIGINASGHLTITQALDYNNAYEVTVKVRLDGTDMTATTVVSVPVVSLTVQPDVQYVAPELFSESSEFTAVVSGLENYSITWTIAKGSTPNDFRSGFITGTQINGVAGDRDKAIARIGTLDLFMSRAYIKAELNTGSTYDKNFTDTAILSKDSSAKP